MSDENATPHVLTAIHGVMADIGRMGIGKDRENKQQGFSFRGIDDIQQVLSPLLRKHALALLPKAAKHQLGEVRQTKSGGAMYDIIATVQYALVSLVDGSDVSIEVIGEGQDSADKATGKAMSQAYKYAAIQAFCIPTAGQPDIEDDNVEGEAPATPLAQRIAEWTHPLTDLNDVDSIKRHWANAAATFRQGGDAEAHAAVKEAVTRRLGELFGQVPA